MQLLEAVNEVLRSVGESPVGSLNTSHPEIKAILACIHAETLRRQQRGWWFNLHVTTLTTADVPADTRFARPLDMSKDYYPKGGKLHDRRTGQPIVDFPCDVEIQRQLDFEDLPDEFAYLVVTAAALAYAAEYDADELHLQALGTKVKEADIEVKRLHIRYYAIGKVSKRLQHRGWWFNTWEGMVTPGPDGTVPKEMLLCIPKQRSLDYILMGGKLIDRHTRQPVTQPVQCEVHVFVESFPELPQSFQDYVVAQAELERAQDFLPESSSIPRLQMVATQARENVGRDHIKYAKVNLFWMNSVGGKIAQSWGMRYR